MRRGWEAEARNWAEFTRTPGGDVAHEDINLPAFLRLLPGPAGLTLDLGCGEGRLGRVLLSRGYQVAGVDAAPTMVRLAVGYQTPEPAVLADAAALPFRDGAFGLDLPQRAPAAGVLQPRPGSRGPADRGDPGAEGSR
jgi:SAM-dependent methyltransferase